MEDIAVSVICNTYNHAAYIKDALDGFVMQKTNFKFEVLVHDDASTDGTADIVREYEAKYPDIIKPIYQKENQYSQQIQITLTYQYPRVKGKYIAFCEGDDYWTDCLKLQKQFDAMEAHPDIDICAHASSVLDMKTAKFRLHATSPADTVLSADEVIEGGGSYVSTCTLFCRSKLIENLPDSMKYYHLDYIIQINGSLRGGMLYLNDDMAVYRFLTNNSWSTTHSTESTRTYKHCAKLYNALEMIDEESDRKCSLSIKKHLQFLKKEILSCMLSNREFSIKDIKSSPYYGAYSELSSSERFKAFVRRNFPTAIKYKRKIFYKLHKR